MRITLLALCVGLSAAGTCTALGEHNLAGKLEIKGSDTMVHLVAAWAEEFMKVNADAVVSVTGGGSGTGIAAMINGTTKICMSSRDVKPKEVELAKAKGIAFRSAVVARDALAIVVHQSNPVQSLDLEQLRRIYNGQVKNWKEVGGPDQPIQVLSRETSSGTYEFFREAVLKKDDYAKEVRLMPSTAAIVQSVSQDAPAIGYVGLGYAAGAPVKVLTVKAALDKDAVAPSSDTVTAGTYPLARALYIYTAGEPGGLAKAFIDFALSGAGQKVVKESGYVPVK